ncbi:hypothetical protein ERO13_A04G023533v2 [Gossypium hirsutum]|uniref:Uncharacterized protein n=1 Tax=Gossypium tomentosum TaxID=34277 RepID=A0A5D2QV65_GOSTO|nr:hypothetical protein ERO13_A04G023533v2 [Gossypium hirsutum]TYI32052.1 hypothetical protein ES332_A04G031200v1 [Gossypium tomentosum]
MATLATHGGANAKKVWGEGCRSGRRWSQRGQTARLPTWRSGAREGRVSSFTENRFRFWATRHLFHLGSLGLL